MPKNIDDVILPERRKSIRNIPIPDGRRKAEHVVATDGIKKRAPKVNEAQEEHSEIPPKRVPPPRRHRSGGRRVFLTAVVGLIIVAFAVLSVFDGATFAYTPKSAALTFANEIFSAAKTGEGDLSYSVVKLSGDKGKAVAASGEREVSRKASGIIVVYNDTATEQQLIENTRFESKAGKIYRIQQSISLPAKKGTQPGSLEVTVYADAAGDSYNSAPTDFTVPGLKGTPRYTTIYARSKGPIAGGFVGKERSVSDADLMKARSELRTTLTEELLSKAQAEVPEDFILFPSLSSVTFEDLPQTPSETAGNVTINLRGSLYGIMFKKTELAKELSHNKVVLSSTDSVDLNSFDGLKLSYSGTPPTDLLSLNKINFKVEGAATLLWRTDEVALESDLLGRQKKEVASILKNYPTIASADTTLRPFWKMSFPKEADKVTIKKLKAQ
jgi:hypothetical protein